MKEIPRVKSSERSCGKAMRARNGEPRNKSLKEEVEMSRGYG